MTAGTPFHLDGAQLAHHDGRSTFETIIDANHLSEVQPELAAVGLMVRVADEIHGPVAFRHASLAEAQPPDAPPESAGLQTMLHGVRVLAADDHDGISRAVEVMDALLAALLARDAGAPARATG